MVHKEKQRGRGVWHHNGSLLLPLFRLRLRLRLVLARVAWPSVNPLLYQSELMMEAAVTNVRESEELVEDRPVHLVLTGIPPSGTM